HRGERDALARFLARLAQDKPIILFVDDAQWLDEESLELLRQFSAAGIGSLLILATCRYGEDGSAPELALPGHTKYDLALGNLGAAGCAELIASILRLPGVPDATAELIGSRAMGNPLFVEQLTAYLQESGSLNDKGALTAEVGYLSSFGISDIVGARIDRLADNVRESVTSASVLGAEFNVRVLARMLNREELPELADVAKCRIWKALDELRYIFTHILIRDTIYQRTVSAKLRQLHQLAEEALETLHHGNLSPVAEEIARHCLLAGLDAKAADYLAAAASRYLEESLFSKAEQCAAQALRIRQKEYGAEDSRSVAALALLAKIRYGQGRYPEAEEQYRQVAQLREQRLGPDHPDTLQALYELASLHVDQGEYATTEPVFRRIIDKRTELLGREHPDTAMAMVSLATCYTLQGKLDQAEPLAKEALDILSRVRGREHADTLSALNNLANLHIYKGEWESAEQLLLEALPLWSKLRGQDHPDLAMSLNNLANIHLNQKKYDLAEPLYQRVVVIYERILGVRHPHTAVSWFNLAGVYAGMDRYTKAEPLFLKALEVWQSSLGDAHPYTVMAIQTLSEIYREMGDPAKSEHYRSLLPAEQEPAPA
ncbi:MAG TPA: tetratricopeptide repeat protein, partial [Candidatus Syntrophosphaera sp.]|nr:tetratricopeptide repeat protein [Candidatus Syntrophosphaera sp.]